MSNGTLHRVYREINRFGLLLSTVGAAMMLYYRLYVVAGVFVLCSLFFIQVLRESPLRSLTTGGERNVE